MGLQWADDSCVAGASTYLKGQFRANLCVAHVLRADSNHVIQTLERHSLLLWPPTHPYRQTDRQTPCPLPLSQALTQEVGRTTPSGAQSELRPEQPQRPARKNCFRHST
eukprot:GHVU01058269.1.p3 GENE.GHVU01058269.1~~GHVU01058269.1.p3  ORF type:complete len:109 (+),score=7.01 GHVU01058269.1:137-463(+)